MRKMVLVLTGVVLMAGCQSTVKTRFRETVVSEDGGSFTTEYDARSRGDVEGSVHSLYSNGEVAQVGQGAQGVTSPAHTEAARMLGQMLPGLIEGLGQASALNSAAGALGELGGLNGLLNSGVLDALLNKRLELRGVTAP